MKFPLLTLLLAPVIVWQGRRVKKTTPRLPEAAGERTGRGGEGKHYKVLIAGDSAAAGVGATEQSEALSGCLHRKLADHSDVEWRLLAKTGDRLADMLAALHSAPPEAYDLAVISIGVNDVTGMTSLGAWRQRLEDATGLLEAKFGVRHIVYTAVPPMHLFPVLPHPLRWYLGVRAKQLNKILTNFVDTHSQCSLVTLPSVENASEVMAEDGFHPGPKVYDSWASEVANLVLQKDRQKIS